MINVGGRAHGRKTQPKEEEEGARESRWKQMSAILRP